MHVVSTRSRPENLKYPKSVFFIFSNEFCERFSYYGMRTVLVLYLSSKAGGLGYNGQTSTMIYHTFVMMCYFTPLLGGIIADAWIGKFRTIFYISIIYAIGNVSLATGAFPQPGIPSRVLALLGLSLIGWGTGGIKPCVSSFGGDQFVLPEQQKQLDQYFSIFYFSINVGSLISSFTTPMMREMKCMGQDTCYALAFGLPALLMILATIIFVSGKKMYTMKAPEGKSVAIEVCKCVGYAIATRVKSREKKPHWLDYSEPKYSRRLIEETKILLNLCLLFAPTIVFWALFEQQGSNWTFQAHQMDGRVGSYVILPDQMQALNAVLVIIFIPLFNYIIYPVCDKLHLIRTSLQRISLGGFLAALSFILSGILQFYVNGSSPVFPEPGQSQLRIYNNLNFPVELIPEETPFNHLQTPIHILPYGEFRDLTIDTEKPTQILTDIVSSSPNFKNNTAIIELNNKMVSSYLILPDSEGNLELFPLNTRGYEELDKVENGNPKVKFLYNLVTAVDVTISVSDTHYSFKLDPSINGSFKHQSIWIENITSGVYDVTVGGNKLKEVDLQPGAVYMFMLMNETTGWDYKIFTLTSANNISMLWQIPQYVVITASEVLFSITGLEFCYNQSPDSMKSFVSSLWLITDSLGNIIVLIIEGIDMFQNPAYNYLLFAVLMTVVMLCFVFLAIKYKQPEFEVDENNRIVVRAPTRANQ